VDKLGNLLPRVLAKQPGAAKIVEMRLRLAFVDLIGPSLAGNCELIEVRGSAVSITTSNPALAHQLRLDSELLMARLNERQLGRRIRSIRVRTGR